MDTGRPEEILDVPGANDDTLTEPTVTVLLTAMSCGKVVLFTGAPDVGTTCKVPGVGG